MTGATMAAPATVGAAPAWRSDAGLAGRSVVVTGAAGGIGGAVARALAEAGSIVVAVDQPGSAVEATCAALPGTGHLALVADLRDTATHAALFEAARSAAPLAALVHAAGVIVRKPVEDVTQADVDLQIDVNVASTFFVNRTAWQAFVDQGSGGSIVNFSSQGWWTGGFEGSVLYAATKGAVVSMTRGLARTFAPSGVRVNAVAPGQVDTAMLRDGVSDEARAGLVAMIPMGRLAAADEMAGAVMFLASDASAYVTGAVLNVSGGQLMY